jgi:glycosyltransferase involved in cell wall biosynthesis
MYKQGIDATTLPLPLYLLKRLPFKLIFRKAVYESQKIIVPSLAVKHEVVAHFKIPEEKVVVTYEGVSINSKLQIQNSNILEKHKITPHKYFLYVGNAYPHKNIKRAIEAIVLLNKEAKEIIHFVIVSGRGVFRERLMKTIKELHANDYIKVLDFIEDNELLVLYKNSLGFVFPSLSEGFGLPGLEALQGGTQLLASDISVFKEIYNDKAFYFDPKNIYSIKETMQKVLKGDKKKDASVLLKEYSWEKMAKETLHLYKSL